VRLVRSGVAKLIGAVHGADPEAAGRLRRALAFDYSRPRDKPECDWRKKSIRERMLSEVASDARRAAAAVCAEPELAGAPAIAEALALLEQLIGQDFEIDQDDVPRLRRGVAQGRIVSVVDPEMRHGRKSASSRFDGYKIHAAATSDGRLITGVGVSPGADHDGAHAAGLVDQQAADRRPARIMGDTAYGDQATRAALASRRVDVLALVPAGAPAHDRFPKADFRIDLEGGHVTCPAGQGAPIGPRHASGQRVAGFARAVCAGCPMRARCLPPGGQRQIRIGPREDLLIAARAALEDPPTAAHLRRSRPRIERLLSLLAHRYRGRKSRYFGRQKSLLQAAWSAALVNLNPIGAALRAQAA